MDTTFDDEKHSKAQFDTFADQIYLFVNLTFNNSALSTDKAIIIDNSDTVDKIKFVHINIKKLSSTIFLSYLPISSKIQGVRMELKNRIGLLN